MKKLISTILLTLAIAACEDTSSVPSAPVGIYFGTITPSGGSPDGATALFSTDNRVGIIDDDTLERFMGTIASNSITGALFSTAVVPATGQVTAFSGGDVVGTYSSSIGGGSFLLVPDPNLFNRGASFAKLTGVWVDAVDINGIGTTTWTFQSNGSFVMTSVSGCAATGQISLIDPTKNEYDISPTITNCPGFNGTYSGMGALTDDVNTDDEFVFMFNNGSVGPLFAPIKQ